MLCILYYIIYVVLVYNITIIVCFLCAWPACERQWSQQQLSAAWFQSVRHSMHFENFIGKRFPKLVSRKIFES